MTGRSERFRRAAAHTMSLRSTLLLAFAAVILLALTLAGAASVVLRWQGEQQAQLDRLAVASPQLSFDLFRLQRQGGSQDQITDFVREAARQQRVRVLLIDRNNLVTVDSADTLRGKRLDVPSEGSRGRPLTYQTWDGTGAEQ